LEREPSIDDVYLIRINDGEVSGVDAQAPEKSGLGDVVIAAPADDWAQFLKPLPEPWYHEFYPASAHHGFRLTRDDHGQVTSRQRFASKPWLGRTRYRGRR
jgi:hypothetical protein